MKPDRQPTRSDDLPDDFWLGAAAFQVDTTGLLCMGNVRTYVNDIDAAAYDVARRYSMYLEHKCAGDPAESWRRFAFESMVAWQEKVQRFHDYMAASGGYAARLEQHLQNITNSLARAKRHKKTRPKSVDAVGRGNRPVANRVAAATATAGLAPAATPPPSATETPRHAPRRRAGGRGSDACSPG